MYYFSLDRNESPKDKNRGPLAGFMMVMVALFIFSIVMIVISKNGSDDDDSNDNFINNSTNMNSTNMNDTNNLRG